MREYGLCLTCREDESAQEAAEIDAEIAREELEALSADPEFGDVYDQRRDSANAHRERAFAVADALLREWQHDRDHNASAA